MGCLNATIGAALSELSTGPEASDASLAQQVPLAELSHSLSFSALLCLARPHIGTLLLDLAPNLKIPFHLSFLL